MESNNNTKIGADELFEVLAEPIRRKSPPDPEEYRQIILGAIEVLKAENPDIRPPDSQGRSGGLVSLKPELPTIIVPDIHARMEFVYSVLAQRVGDGKTVAHRLDEGTAQIVCVGDGFHSEKKGAARWKKAYEEFQDGFRKHKAMDDEMRESFGVMEMVMRIKAAFPDYFHFLKGNHENIANEEGHGNHPFRKYAYEGPMVLEYVTKFYGREFLDTFYRFEKELPVFVVGNGFLISHAEPVVRFTREEIVNYRDNPDVVEGLTWTGNDAAEEGSVAAMLEDFLGEDTAGNGYYFGGHRPVDGLFDLRADGRYVQICTPGNFTIGIVKEEFDPEQDIVEIEDKTVDL
jgi:hypothetical protein